MKFTKKHKTLLQTKLERLSEILSTKLAQNIKSDSKSFYAYVRSKQNVRDKVGRWRTMLEILITEGCLMAEELNVHFSFSVHEGRY